MGKGAAAGVALALILGTLIGYFLIPMVFPAGSQGQIIQTKFVQNDINTWRFNTHRTTLDLLGMSLNITTKGSSYLMIRFDSQYRLHIDSASTGEAKFEIAISVNGQFIKNGTIGIDTDPFGSFSYEDRNFITMLCITDPLPANTYNIKITARSICDAGALCTLYFYSESYNRTLLVQEIGL